MKHAISVANKFSSILRTAQPAELDGASHLDEMMEDRHEPPAMEGNVGDNDLYISLAGPAIGAVDLGLQQSHDGKFQLTRDDHVINEFDSQADATAGLLAEIGSYVKGMSATARVARDFMRKLGQSQKRETTRVAESFMKKMNL